VFPLQELTKFRLADRSGDVVGPDESLVAEHSARFPQDLLDSRSFQFSHVVLVAGNGLGNERYPALKIRDNQGAVSRGLVFPSPQVALAVPGPAWPQRAVYQGDRVPGGLGCVLCRWPVFLCCPLDKWREKSDVPRYRRLIDVEDVGPYILDDVLPQISAGNDERFAQGQFTRAPGSFIPRLFE